MRDELPETCIAAKEMLADVLAVGDDQTLRLAVRRLVHAVHERAIDVLREQLVPLAAPDHLDDVPAGAAEHGLELLNDLAVPAHGTIEPLQVAVHDEREVVESLARRDVQRAERLGLVALAIAKERPHALPAGVLHAAVVQVAVEARLVDRGQRAEAHRYRGELPELRHETRVRVRREPLAAP